jgi:phosphoribosylformylglycinamidine synthase
MSFSEAGLELYLLGETRADLAGSEWAYLHGQRGGKAPHADLKKELQLIDLLVAGRTKKIFTAAHDVSQGGLSATLTEMVLRHNVGATVECENVGIALVSETPGRVVVAVDPSQRAALEKEAAAHGIALTHLGTTGGDKLVINGAEISLDELRIAHTQTLPKLFG